MHRQRRAFVSDKPKKIVSFSFFYFMIKLSENSESRSIIKCSNHTEILPNSDTEKNIDQFMCNCFNGFCLWFRWNIKYIVQDIQLVICEHIRSNWWWCWDGFEIGEKQAKRNEIMLTSPRDMNRKIEKDARSSKAQAIKERTLFFAGIYLSIVALAIVLWKSSNKSSKQSYTQIIITARSHTFNFEFINMYWDALNTCVPIYLFGCWANWLHTTYIHTHTHTHIQRVVLLLLNCNVMSENWRSFSCKGIVRRAEVWRREKGTKQKTETTTKSKGKAHIFDLLVGMFIIASASNNTIEWTKTKAKWKPPTTEKRKRKRKKKQVKVKETKGVENNKA